MCMNTHIHWRTKNKTRLHFVTPFNPSMENVTRNGNLAMPTAPGPRANIVCVGGIRAPRKPCLRGWNPGGGVAPRATGGGTSHE